MGKKKNQKGGIGINKPLDPNSGWLRPSTSGSPKAFVSDVVAVIYSSINSIVSGTETIKTLIETPGNMGRAVTAPNTPNPNSVSVP